MNQQDLLKWPVCFMAGEARNSLDPHANLNIHSTTMLVHWRAGDDVRSKKLAFGEFSVFEALQLKKVEK